MAVGVDATPNGNEYQRCLLGGRTRPVCRSDNLANAVCRLSRNSWSLNLLEPQKACSALHSDYVQKSAHHSGEIERIRQKLNSRE